MAKRPCIQRAEWRLLRGKPAQHLSAHYQLDCDYGTTLVAIYKEGEGDDPVYLCESHATEVRSAGERRVSIRAVEAPAPAPASQATERDDAAVVPANSAIISAPSTPTAALEPAIPVSATAPNGESPSPGPLIAEAEPAPAAIADAPPISAATPATTFADFPSNTTAPAAASASTSAPPNLSSGASTGASINTSPAVALSARPARPAVSTFTKAPARDLSYGDTAKALVDEAIWNMEPGAYDIYWAALRQGKPAAEAAQAAGGQLAIVHRKIGEYTAKIEGVLSKSTARISVEDAIDKPFDQAILEIIGGALADAKKDAAIDQLGTLQEWMKRGLDREMTPLQAHQIARAIGDRANWGASTDLPEELKPAYRALYGSVRNALRAAVPHANNLDERLTNLFAARSDLENVPTAKALHPVTA